MRTKYTIMTVVFCIAAGCSAPTYRAAEIRDRLSDTPNLAAHEIAIDEREPGYVTLNGSVASVEDRDKIESIARKTDGVREVRSNLTVDPSHVIVREGVQAPAPGQAAPVNQRVLISEILARMSAAPDLRNYNLTVDAVGGEVTLRGAVGNDRERLVAERIARSTPGVTGLRNEIVVIR